MPKRAVLTTSREAALRTLLESRRRELTAELNGQIRHVRSRDGEIGDVSEDQDGAEADIQEDIDLTLIQIKSQVLSRIDVALRRLDQGVYGDCVECGGPISQGRLSALPFAIRCKTCEETRESTATGGQRQPQRRGRGSASLDSID